jgi:fibronectin type 3 domain-containing protein
VAASALLLCSCGYIGEPLYPLLNIPSHVTDLAAVQRGSAIIFQFTLPVLTTEGKQARIGQVEVRIGESGQGAFDLKEWVARSKGIDVGFDKEKHILSETPAAPWVGKEVVIAVKVLGVNKRDAGWSNLAIVNVVAALAAPTDVEAAAVAEGVRVSWQGPAGRYRVFRRAEQDLAVSLMTTVEANQWVDTTTEYGKQYHYIIQAVQKSGSGEVESEISREAAVTPVDVFPPVVPKGLNAIAAAENIELVWERDTEPDLAGYRLYRAVGDGKLEKLADIQDAPSYSDRKLESGKRYRYAVSAVDRLGNESKLSEPVEVTAP